MWESDKLTMGRLRAQLTKTECFSPILLYQQPRSSGVGVLKNPPSPPPFHLHFTHTLLIMVHNYVSHYRQLYYAVVKRTHLRPKLRIWTSKTHYILSSFHYNITNTSTCCFTLHTFQLTCLQSSLQGYAETIHPHYKSKAHLTLLKNLFTSSSTVSHQ